jgi:signal transduction histidine kinase
MLSHLGLVLLAMVVLGFYLVRSVDWFYLQVIQSGMRDEVNILAERLGPELAAGNRDAVRRYLEEIGQNISVRVLVADVDGTIVGSTEPEESNLVGQSGIAYGLSRALQDRIEHVSRGVNRPNEDVVSIVAPIDWDGRQVGAVRLSHQLGDLYLQLFDLMTTILVGMAVAGSVSLLLSMVLAQSLSAPARGLAAAARALSSGKLDYRINPRGNDEIREAGRAFDALAARLQEMEWARQQLLGDVAHDLHSSITGVGMAVEALQQGAADDPAMRSLLLDGLASHSQRLHRMADDLLQTARMEAGRLQLHREELSPGVLLRSLAAEFAAEAAQLGVTLELHMETELPSVRADGQRLAQALGNLVENAIRHTPTGRRVILGGEARDRECLLFVRDEGPGIPEQDLPKLFDRFKRFSEGRPGRLGFGLAIAKGLVEAHGGRIEVESGEEEGTTFTVVLPVGGQETAPLPVHQR